MKTVHKFKPGIVSFIVNSKLKNPDISCRKLALEASEKFGIKLSKSAINNIFKKEKLSSPVGRRSEHLFHLEGERSSGGFYILRALDESLRISKILSEVLLNVSPSARKSFVKEIENIMQALIIYKSIFDVTIDFSKCYDNEQVWEIVGQRPTKAIYSRIIKILQDSQVFVDEAVKEIKQRLNPVIGFRFRLKDESSFFIDGALNSIWPSPVNNSSFYTTYYKSSSYINNIIRGDTKITIFNTQDFSIFSNDTLNFLASFDAQDSSKQLKQIELLGRDGNVLETKQIGIAERRFFFLGFWPWQLDIIPEFERKPAKQKIAWSDFGIEYYYQIEEFLVPQHLANKGLKLPAIILKRSPLGAVRMGILTNLPMDVIHNFLSYKDLYNWCFPEDRYKDFLKKIKKESRPPEATSIISSKTLQVNQLDDLFLALSGIILERFQNLFLGENFRSIDQPKIKELLSRQKVILKTTKEFILHNFIPDNELWKETEMRYACQRLSESGIKDGEGRILVFK